ncbi:MAG TPA: DUF4173 domain-containing protein [Pyrinomonadaceae bacterium]|nr:DUF4173 domain-containing protein [Pyrinomonadaceae bacterium]
MNEHTKIGLHIILAAVVIGMASDGLLHVDQWGINVLAFNVVFVGAAFFLMRRFAKDMLTPHTYALFGAQVFFAACFAWRAAPELRVACTGAILCIMSAQMIPALGVTTRLAGVVHYAVGFVWSTINSFFGSFLLIFSDIEFSSIENSGWKKHLFSVMRSLLIVTPVLLIFGALFAAADAAFEGLVNRVFNFEFEDILQHFMLFAVFAWFSAGYLRAAIVRSASNGAMIGVPFTAAENVSKFNDENSASETSRMADVARESGEHPVTLPDDKTVVEHINTEDSEAETRPVGSVPDSTASPVEEKKPPFSFADINNSFLPTGFTLGAVEIGIIFGLINLLFLTFVIIQVPYLFGGMEMVQNTPDFKLADYARRGFGELVAVSALVLPLLLASHWLIRREAKSATLLFKIFAGIQIALLFVIMASAVQRLLLLTGSLGYGLTTIRLYPMIFMTWLAIVFVWFAVTVMRGHRQYFALGAMWSAFFIIGATHVLNPDAFIVRTNIALMQQGREFDANYNSRLSADAIQELLPHLAQFSLEDRETILRNFKHQRCEIARGSGFRSWNLSRTESFAELEKIHADLLQFGNCESEPKFE